MSKADVDRFALRAKTLRERLQQNQVVTGEAASILVEFEDQLASLCRATEPIRTRTQALTRAQLNIERIQAHAEELLEHLDVSRKVERRIREGPGADLDGYLELTRQLSKAIRFLQGCEHLKSTKSALRHATELRAAALSHCEQRFREALSRSTVRAEFPALAQQALASMESLREDLRSGASSKTSQAPREEGLTLVRPEAIGTLRKIAAVALEADNQNQSLQILKVFADSRRRALHGIVQHSGVDMGSRDEVHRMAWDALEKKIQGWIVLSHVLARVVACERRLAGTVFRPPYDDMTFSEVVYPTVEDFVLYGHSITSVKRTPEKVFALLDMKEHLESLKELMRGVLGGATCAPLLGKVQRLLRRLGNVAHGTFVEFEAAVAGDGSKHVVRDGTVHPLTAYVINYVKRLFSYRGTLVALFREARAAADSTSSAEDGAPVETPRGGAEAGGRIAGSIVNILIALLQNLEAKSEMYKDGALRSLFLMNNVNYVVGSMRSYGSSQLLPEEWMARHAELVSTHKSQYLQLSWDPLFASLRAPLDVPENKRERRFVRERFRFINQQLKGLSAQHREWAIPDDELRREVRRTLLGELVPLYTKMREHYWDVFFSKKPEAYITYTGEDLRRMVEEDFFSRS